MPNSPYMHVTEQNPFGFHERLLPISEIRGHPKNPRKISLRDKEELRQSLSRFGLIDKPIVNTDMTLIGGHQRIALLKEDGRTDVLCMVAEKQLTEKEVEELLIRHNKNRGEWDNDLLGKWDFDSLLSYGFNPADLPTAIDEALTKEQADPVFPLVPRMSETYDYVIVIAKNEIEKANLHNFFELEANIDYKVPSRVGVGRVVTFEKFNAIVNDRASKSGDIIT